MNKIKQMFIILFLLIGSMSYPMMRRFMPTGIIASMGARIVPRVSTMPTLPMLVQAQPSQLYLESIRSASLRLSNSELLRQKPDNRQEEFFEEHHYEWRENRESDRKSTWDEYYDFYLRDSGVLKAINTITAMIFAREAFYYVEDRRMKKNMNSEGRLAYTIKNMIEKQDWYALDKIVTDQIDAIFKAIVEIAIEQQIYNEKTILKKILELYKNGIVSDLTTSIRKLLYIVYVFECVSDINNKNNAHARLRFQTIVTRYLNIPENNQKNVQRYLKEAVKFGDVTVLSYFLKNMKVETKMYACTKLWFEIVAAREYGSALSKNESDIINMLLNHGAKLNDGSVESKTIISLVNDSSFEFLKAKIDRQLKDTSQK